LFFLPVSFLLGCFFHSSSFRVAQQLLHLPRFFFISPILLFFFSHSAIIHCFFLLIFAAGGLMDVVGDEQRAAAWSDGTAQVRAAVAA
jgi:hypothetical protein